MAGKTGPAGTEAGDRVVQVDVDADGIAAAGAVEAVEAADAVAVDKVSALVDCKEG